MWGSCLQMSNDLVRPMPKTYWRSLGESHSGLSDSGEWSLRELAPVGPSIVSPLSFFCHTKGSRVMSLSYDMTRLRASCLWCGPPYGSLPFSRISLATVCLLTRMLRPT